MRWNRAFMLVSTILTFFWSPLRADEWSVLCLLSSACVLPCPFDPGPEVLIHWQRPPDDHVSVHSFYYGSDQLELQDPHFKGRTALFNERIPEGNASLRITGVQVSDRGRYKCYTSTMTGKNEDYITVDVQAPVSEVHLEDDGQSVRCFSSDIFPSPRVSWTPSSENISSSVTPSQTGLFSVVSSVPLTQRPPLEYSCNISTEHSWRSATYRRTEGVTWSGSETQVPCAEPQASVKSLVWTFNRTETILKVSGSSSEVYSPGWEHRVGLGPGSDLVLKDLSPDQQGLFFCELRTDKSTFLTVTEVTVGEAPMAVTDQKTLGAFLGVAAVLLVSGIVFYFVCRKKKMSKKPKESQRAGEGEKRAELEELYTQKWKE